MKVTIQFQETGSESEATPQIVSFPSGPPANLKEAVFDVNSGKCSMKDEDGDVTFEGCIDKHSSSSFGIGVFDPNTKTLKLSHVEGIYELRRVKEQSDESKVEDSKAAGSAAAKRRRLIEDFGSKKKKQKLRSADMNRVDIEKAGSSTAIDLALRKGQEAASTSMEAPKREFLPPHDLNTTDPAEIYDIKMIIPADESEAMDFSQVFEMARKKAVLEAHKFDYSGFVIACIRTLKQRNLKRDRVNSLSRVLLYTDYLIRLFKIGSKRFRDVNEAVERLQCCDVVAQSLLNRFRDIQSSGSNQVRYATTQATKARLLCHICVLAMHCFGQNIPKLAFTKLSTDLKISSTQLFSYFTHIGATVKQQASADDQIVASLRAPLKLPTERRGPRS